MKPNSARNWLFKGLFSVGIVVGALFALSVAFKISGSLGGPGYDLFSIPSGSMEPTVRVGDRIFALANVYGDTAPPRGDVVVFRNPENRRADYDKRVIGLPGDVVQYKQGRLYINGAMVERKALSMDEVAALNYAGDRTPNFYWEQLPSGPRYVIAELADDFTYDNTEEFRVPPGRLLLLGDNRDNSLDSRSFGFVPLELVHAKMLYVYWSKDKSRIGTRIE